MKQLNSLHSGYRLISIHALTLIMAVSVTITHAQNTGTDTAVTPGTHSAIPTLKSIGLQSARLDYFTVSKRDEHSAILKWVTVSEINNSRFDVERSTDGTLWSKVGEVKGAGNSNDQLDYSLADDAPLLGTSYYRLRQVGLNGHCTYSDAAEIAFGVTDHSAAVMTLYPTLLPHGETLNVALAGTADGIRHIAVADGLGRYLYIYDPEGEQRYAVPGLNMAAGTYTVSIWSESNEKFMSEVVIK